MSKHQINKHAIKPLPRLEPTDHPNSLTLQDAFRLLMGGCLVPQLISEDEKQTAPTSERYMSKLTGAPEKILVRGVLLPRGMTRACCDDLARLFNSVTDPESDATNDELAAEAFEVVRRHLPKIAL